MLNVVIEDLIPFLIILSVFIIAFTTSHAILYKDVGVSGLASSFLNEWLLMFGEYEGDDYEIYTSYDGEPEHTKMNVVVPLLFFASTSILPLLLLNLVIAIMSDSYEKVITNDGESDNQQLN